MTPAASREPPAGAGLSPESDEFARVAPLVARRVHEGRNLHIAFRCPASGSTWLGEARLERVPPLGESPPLEELRPAVLRAFAQVREHFTWDAVEHRYVAWSVMADARTALARLMSACPVRTEVGREVADRAMVELATLAAVPSEAQGELFDALSRTGRPLSELAALDALTDSRLAAVSPAERDLVLALAATIAWAEGEPDELQVLRLERFRRVLRIGADRYVELTRVARDFVLDQALEAVHAHGRGDERRLRRLVARMGVEDEALGVAVAQVRRRHGLSGSGGV